MEPVPARTKTSTSRNESLSDSDFSCQKCDLIFLYARYKLYTQALDLPSNKDIHPRRSTPKPRKIHLQFSCTLAPHSPPWAASAAHRVQSAPARPLLTNASKRCEALPAGPADRGPDGPDQPRWARSAPMGRRPQINRLICRSGAGPKLTG